jgi:plasmid stability protein
MATIKFELNSSFEQQLRSRAAERGTDIDSAAREIVETSLTRESQVISARDLSHEQRLQALQELLKTVPKVLFSMIAARVFMKGAANDRARGFKFACSHCAYRRPPASVGDGRNFKLLNQQNDLYIVPQAIYEFWVVVTRPTSVNGLAWISHQ